jgi:thioredoxin reductase
MDRKMLKIISRWPNGTSRSARLHESLGLATVDTPLGIALKVDERRETSMPGIYAAGDLANPLMASVTLATSHGATAGISAQQSMLV